MRCVVCLGNREGSAETEDVGDEAEEEEEVDGDGDGCVELAFRLERVKSVIGSGGKDDELARIDWSGIKVRSPSKQNLIRDHPVILSCDSSLVSLLFSYKGSISAWKISHGV